MSLSACHLLRASCIALAATAALGGAANAACPADDSGLKLPDGFCAGIFADDVGHARHMAISADGVLYVNTWSGRYYGNTAPHDGGFLVALKDTKGTGKADVIQRFGETVQSGGAGGTGIGIYDGYLYAEINDKIVRYALARGSIAPSGAPQTVVSGLPLGGDHPMHPFAIDAGGSLYVDMGTATNACQVTNRTLKSPGIEPCVETDTRGGIWRFDARQTGQVFSPAQRYATGVRNAEGFAVDTAGRRIFITQHGRDQLHANWPDLYAAEQEATLPSEEVLLLTKGADYGWPKCYYDPGQAKLVLAPEFGGDGGKAVGPCAAKTGPVAAFPAHWAPNGMTYYDKRQFPARYRNGLFIAFHGSWDRAPFAQAGYNVVFQSLSGDKAGGKCEIFADGFAGAGLQSGKATHRPNGVTVAPDGALFVSDDSTGRIYRITYSGKGDASGPVTACPDLTAAPGPVIAGNKLPDFSADTKEAPLAPGATKAMVALGAGIYRGEVGGAPCTGCHGPDAAGTALGPDLTDQTWLWSDGSVAGIAATIIRGVPQPKQYRAPMPALGGAQLNADQVTAVSAYVWGLSHTAAATAGGAAHPAELLIPGEKIYPESLTSTADGRVIIGSIGTRSIFVVAPGSATAKTFVAADPDTSLAVFGVFADNKAGTLWACFSPIGPPAAKASRSALKAFDLQTGKFEAAYVLPTSGAFCNDIAMAPDGVTYVTDTNNMEVIRLKGRDQALEVWAGDGEFGVKGGVLDGIAVLGDRVFVNTLMTGKLFSVPILSNGKSGPAVEVDLGRPLDHPDGMRSYGANRLLVVEGGGAGRLSLVTPGGGAAQVAIVKEGYPQGPVAVTMLGTMGYVLEGQLGALFGHPDPSGPKPFHATAVELPP